MQLLRSTQGIMLQILILQENKEVNMKIVKCKSQKSKVKM